MTHTHILSLHLICSAASAFTFQAPTQQASTALNAESRREAFAKIAGVAAGFAAAAPAFADREYNEVGLLGGGQVVDVNNGTCGVMCVTYKRIRMDVFVFDVDD